MKYAPHGVKLSQEKIGGHTVMTIHGVELAAVHPQKSRVTQMLCLRGVIPGRVILAPIRIVIWISLTLLFGLWSYLSGMEQVVSHSPVPDEVLRRMNRLAQINVFHGEPIPGFGPIELLRLNRIDDTGVTRRGSESIFCGISPDLSLGNPLQHMLDRLLSYVGLYAVLINDLLEIGR